MAEEKNGTLNNFIALVKTEGLMRSSRYTVSMAVPRSITYPINIRKILLFCSDITIPGVTIATNQIRTHGEVMEAPNEKIYDNANLSFYVDNNMQVKDFFDEWVAKIQHPKTRNFNYYDDYTTDIKIEVEDTENRKRYQVTMYECYPKNIGQIQIGYDQKEVMKLQISMNYKFWSSEIFNAPAETKESPWANWVKVPSLDGRELMSQNSVPDIPELYSSNFTEFQDEYNQLSFDGRA